MISFKNIFSDRNQICYAIAAALMTAGSLTSCSEDFLDKIPDERVEINNVDQVIQLLSSGYSTTNYGWICEVSSDNVVDVNAPYMATQSNGSEIEVRYNLNSYDRMDEEAYCFEPVRSSTGTDSPSEIWEGNYRAIAVANHAIALLDEMKAAGTEEDEKMRAAYGEAYLIRAYHHFVLVNIFSQAYKNDEASRHDTGVPYITDPEDKVMVDYPRLSVTETYNRIEKDMLEGIARVNNSIYNKPKWHFNMNAAHAFAARFYLYKRDYEKVIEHANAVLGTDRANLPSMLMNFGEGFDAATSSKDYSLLWQGADVANNLMLVATYSVQWRRSVGYRFACAGKALRDVFFHLGPNWRWYRMPVSGVAGETFWDGEADHGFMSSRIAESFEYTDKVARIGYAHIIRREFTCNELLLERAEAYLLGRHDKNECFQDLYAYEESRQSFSESNKKFYTQSDALTPLTESALLNWYTPTETNVKNHSNTLADWNFTQNMSGDFIIPDSLTAYMNCLNDMRRYETAWTGLRFFDVKRYGFEYEHHFGPDDVVYKLEWNSPKRAIEVPQEVLVAGMETSQPMTAESGGSNIKNYSGKNMK